MTHTRIEDCPEIDPDQLKEALKMDPDANLREQRSIMEEILKIWDACPEDGEFTDTQRENLSHHAIRLAELVEALDNWIRGGGFLPTAWRK